MHESFRKCLQAGLVVLICSALPGCHRGTSATQAQVIFDRVPPPGRSGTGTVDTLRGHVRGASAGQRIVVYALGDNTWWVQPTALRHFTTMDGAGGWSTVTHPGDRYAVLLVDSAYKPPDQLKELPVEGGHVAALATVTPSGTQPPPRQIRFSTYEWIVRQVGSDRQGSPHMYRPENVQIDSEGALHLHISKEASGYACAEVALSRSLGFGTYAFTVEETSHLDPAAVFDLFTWDEAGTDQERREVDALVSRWGSNLARTNAQYIVQPFFRPANTYRYLVPAGSVTFTFRWEPAMITFETRSRGRVIAHHTFTADVPTPATETVHMNLCTFDYGQLLQQQPSEVVIRRFSFEP